MHPFFLTLVLLATSITTLRAGDDPAKDDKPLVVFQCKEGNCSMKLPSQPTPTISKTAKGDTRSYRIFEKECTYMFSVVEIEELKPLNGAQLERVLDKMNSMLDPAHSKTTLTSKVTLGEYPGREARQVSLNPEKTDGFEAGRRRTFIVGSKLYMILIMGKQHVVDSDRSTQILESLKLDSDRK